MTVLSALTDAIAAGSVEVVDLTAPLSSQTPILSLPEPLGQTWPFALEEISRYDERGPAWYWNNITTGEHTGTHFDAPIHWVTGRDAADVSQVPVRRLIAPAVVLDVSAQARRRTRTSWSRSTHIRAFEQSHGPLPAGGWLLIRTGWDARSADPAAFANEGHTPGISVECAQWLAEKAPIQGVGRGDRRHRRRAGPLVRPAVPVPLVPARPRQVRPDPAAEPGPPAGRPARWSSPARCRSCTARAARAGCWPWSRTDATWMSPRSWAARLVAHGADHVFGVVGSGNFHVTNAMVAAGARFVAAAHEDGAACMADAYGRVSGRLAVLSVHQGPGVTNALTGITEAAKSHTPMVVLAPEATQRGLELLPRPPGVGDRGRGRASPGTPGRGRP